MLGTGLLSATPVLLVMFAPLFGCEDGADGVGSGVGVGAGVGSGVGSGVE